MYSIKPSPGEQRKTKAVSYVIHTLPRHNLLKTATRTNYLREFVLNSRHPDPRRAWKGGSEPRLLPPDLVDPLDPLDRRTEFQIMQICCCFLKVLGDSGDAIAWCFLTFSWTSNLKHLLLRAFWEDCLPEMLSNVGVLAERTMKKSENTSHDSSMELSYICLNVFHDSSI